MQSPQSSNNIFKSSSKTTSQRQSMHSPRLQSSVHSLSSKRSQFHASIRKQNIKVQMQSIRKELVVSNKNEIITQIFQQMQNKSQISTHQLDKLIQYANQQIDDAIIALGTALQNNIIQPKQIGQKIVLGKSHLWGWFLRILNQLQYRELRFIQYSMNNIIKHNYPNYVLIEELQQNLLYLESLSRVDESSLIQMFMQNKNFVYALFILSSHIEPKIYTIAISLLARIIRLCDLLNIFKENQIVTISMNTLSQYFIKILMKLQTNLRALGIQMLTNLAQNQLILPDTVLLILKIAQKQKTLVKVEISYYLEVVLEFLSIEGKMSLIDRGLINILVLYMEDPKLEIFIQSYKCLRILKNEIKKQNYCTQSIAHSLNKAIQWCKKRARQNQDIMQDEQ